MYTFLRERKTILAHSFSEVRSKDLFEFADFVADPDHLLKECMVDVYEFQAYITASQSVSTVDQSVYKISFVFSGIPFSRLPSSGSFDSAH
jgi:hypothetical protein